MPHDQSNLDSKVHRRAGFDDDDALPCLHRCLYWNRKKRKDRLNKSNLSSSVILEEDGGAVLLESTGRIKKETQI